MKDQVVNRGLLFSLVTVLMMLFALHGTTYGQTTLSIDPAEIESPAAGEQFAVNVNISGAAGITAYQFDVLFDPTSLSYVGVGFSDYLPGAFPVPPKADEIETNPDTGLATIRMASLSLAGEGGDMGTLVTITFEVVEAKDSSLQLAEVQVPDPADITSVLAVTTTGSMVSAPAAPVDETPVDETPVDELQSTKHQLTRHQSTKHQLMTTKHQSMKHRLMRLQSMKHRLTRLQSMKHRLTRLQSTKHRLTRL